MEINEDILIRYIDGMLTEEEAAEVKKRRAASLENEKLLEQVYFTTQVASRLKVMRTVNPDEALSRFKSRIHKKEKRLALRQVLGVIQRAAAVLFIPVFLSFIRLFVHTAGSRERAYASRTHESWGGFGVRFT
ncbi:hypothetical protein NXX40_11425 [Parabacteroides distasonis]|nr:hypothetical protein [Parabacteroides distasonis]